MNAFPQKTVPPPFKPDNGDRNNNLRLTLVFILLGISAFAYWMSISYSSSNDFIIIKDGKPTLAPWRQEKMQSELDDLDDSEQYVLIAGLAGWYPCYNCHGDLSIYLEPGQVWKYGVTRKGEKGRYRDGLPAEELLYLIQYQGTLQECLKQEKIKIYHYALLPENLERARPLIRPPGNKQDN